MTHVPCGDGFVERVCRDVACYIDSMVGCYNNSCKHAKRKEPDMLTAAMARDMSGDQRVMEELELFERCIRGAAACSGLRRRHADPRVLRLLVIT